MAERENCNENSFIYIYNEWSMGRKTNVVTIWIDIDLLQLSNLTNIRSNKWKSSKWCVESISFFFFFAKLIISFFM